MAHPAAQGAKLDRVVRVAMVDQAVQEVKSDRVARVATADPEGPAVIPELVVKADRVALVGIQDPDSSSVQSCSSSCHLSSHLISSRFLSRKTVIPYGAFMYASAPITP